MLVGWDDKKPSFTASGNVTWASLSGKHIWIFLKKCRSGAFLWISSSPLPTLGRYFPSQILIWKDTYTPMPIHVNKPFTREPNTSSGTVSVAPDVNTKHRKHVYWVGPNQNRKRNWGDRDTHRKEEREWEKCLPYIGLMSIDPWHLSPDRNDPWI